MRRLTRATGIGVAILSAAAGLAAFSPAASAAVSPAAPRVPGGHAVRAVLTEHAEYAELAAQAGRPGPARPGPVQAVAPHRAAGTATVVGYLRLRKSDARATTQAVLICETVSTGTGGADVTGYGSVADAAAACRELVAVDGDFGRLLVHPTWLVPALAAPVTTSVSGTWTARGQVTFQRTFHNTGELGRYFGDVFAF